MFNIKISGIVAGAAFILSFLIGLFSHISTPVMIIRASVFAVVSVIISILVKFLITRFLPELLERPNQEENPLSRPGSRIDITEGDDFFGGGAPEFTGNDEPADSAVAPNFSQTSLKPGIMGAQPEDSGALGNISDLMGNIGLNFPDTPQTGMDQNGQEGYTGEEGLGAFSAFSSIPAHSSRSAGERASASGGQGAADSAEKLPDMDSMAEVFSPGMDFGSGQSNSDTSDFILPASKSASDKTPEWAEDFKPKDLAEGIKTILGKEKEG